MLCALMQVKLQQARLSNGAATLLGGSGPLASACNPATASHACTHLGPGEHAQHMYCAVPISAVCPGLCPGPVHGQSNPANKTQNKKLEAQLASFIGLQWSWPHGLEGF
jgi:hypothetical protein